MNNYLIISIMINLKKGQDSPSLSENFKREFNNSSNMTLSAINTNLRVALLDKIAFLRRQRDERLVPFVKMSIPEEILSAMSVYPGYFKTSRAVKVTTGARTLVTFVSSSFPTEGDSLKIAVPAFIFDEIASIDNRLEGVLKAIAELK